MNRKGQVSTGELLLIFIAVIVCLAMLPSIINTQHSVTNLQTMTDESTNLATSCLVYDAEFGWSVNESNSACNITTGAWYPTGDWRLLESQCYLTSVVVGNSTLDFTVDTDYEVFDSTGIIRMLNTTATQGGNANTTLLDYSYCDEGYNTSSSSRGVAGLWSLFAALIIVAAAVYGIRKWN